MSDFHEGYDLLRILAPEATDLIDVLERRMILQETMIKLYEGMQKLSAPGDGAVRLPTPDEDGSPVAATTGAGADIIELHKYSWKVDGGAA